VKFAKIQIMRTPVASWQQDTSAAVQNEWWGSYIGFVGGIEYLWSLGILKLKKSNIILKRVVKTRGKHLDLVELLWTRYWNFGFHEMLRISLEEE